MARPIFSTFPTRLNSLTLHKLQTVPSSPSSSSSASSSSPSSSSSLYNNKPNTHLPSGSISFLSLARYPLSVSPSIANVASRTEPEAAESSSGEEEGTGEGEYSNTRLLASNIPFTWTREDVGALFDKYGTVVDIELSMHNKTRNRGLVFVSMGSPEEALAAFEGLQLKEFEGRVLKMNWAKLRKKESSPPFQGIEGLKFTLVVSNLPYDAKSKDLREFFFSEGANTGSAEVIFHGNPRKPAGYGFVRFKSRKDALEALIAFQGKMFNGRPLKIFRTISKKAKGGGSASRITPAESSSVTEQADSPD